MGPFFRRSSFASFVFLSAASFLAVMLSVSSAVQESASSAVMLSASIHLILFSINGPFQNITHLSASKTLVIFFSVMSVLIFKVWLNLDYEETFEKGIFAFLYIKVEKLREWTELVLF